MTSPPTITAAECALPAPKGVIVGGGSATTGHRIGAPQPVRRDNVSRRPHRAGPTS